MHVHTGEHTDRLSFRERLGQVAYGALIFAVLPGLLGVMLVAALYAANHRSPAAPGPAPVTVVPAPLQPPPAPSPVVVVSA